MSTGLYPRLAVRHEEEEKGREREAMKGSLQGEVGLVNRFSKTDRP